MQLWLRMSVDMQVRKALLILGLDHNVFTDTRGKVFYFDGRRHTIHQAADTLLEGGYTASIGRPGPRIRADRRHLRAAAAAA